MRYHLIGYHIRLTIETKQRDEASRQIVAEGRDRPPTFAITVSYFEKRFTRSSTVAL